MAVLAAALLSSCTKEKEDLLLSEKPEQDLKIKVQFTQNETVTFFVVDVIN